MRHPTRTRPFCHPCRRPAVERWPRRRGPRGVGRRRGGPDPRRRFLVRWHQPRSDPGSAGHGRPAAYPSCGPTREQTGSRRHPRGKSRTCGRHSVTDSAATGTGTEPTPMGEDPRAEPRGLGARRIRARRAGTKRRALRRCPRSSTSSGPRTGHPCRMTSRPSETALADPSARLWVDIADADRATARARRRRPRPPSAHRRGHRRRNQRAKVESADGILHVVLFALGYAGESLVRDRPRARRALPAVRP